MTRLTVDKAAPSPQDARQRFERIDNAPDGVAGMRRNDGAARLALVNLRVGIRRRNWDIALFVNNLFDELALLSFDQERGTRARIGFLTNQPRTFGVSTRLGF